MDEIFKSDKNIVDEKLSQLRKSHFTEVGPPTQPSSDGEKKNCGGYDF